MDRCKCSCIKKATSLKTENIFFLDVFSIFLFVFTYSSKDSCGNKSETASKAKSAATEIALLDKKTPLATLILEIRKEKAMEIEKGKREEDQNQKRQRQGQAKGQRGTKGGTDKRNERDKEGQSDTKGHKGGRWRQAKKTERDCGRDKKAKQDLNSRQIQGDTRGHKGDRLGQAKKDREGQREGQTKKMKVTTLDLF